jgi:two-component system, OmpR family, response regulator
MESLLSTDTENRGVRILIVEDDEEVRAALIQYLKQSSYIVGAYGRGRAAINAALTQAFELAIVDLRLPDLHGSALIRSLRCGGYQFPILAITAVPAIDEGVAALDAGASDYLTKPFSMSELESRIKVLLWRAVQEKSCAPIRIANLVVVPGDPRVLIGDQVTFLSGQELLVLEMLTKSAGQVVSTSALALQLSRGSKPLNEATVSVYVHRLRSRLQLADVRIRTLRGFGYLLEVIG